MTQKAQLTVFIVLGLVILSVFALAMYVRVQTVETRVGSLEQQVDLQGERTALKLMVDDCLKQKTVRAIELYGINPDEETEGLITAFVEYEIGPCLDLEQFRKAGFEIDQDAGYAATEISEGALSVELHLPLTLASAESRVSVEDFSFTLQKTRYISLPTDDQGVMLQPFTVTTPNGRAELSIPQGVRVWRSGSPVRQDEVLELRLVDRNHEGLLNALSIGETLYLMEGGIEFDPGAVLTMYYRDGEIPLWESQQDLTLSVYNERTGLWETLPTAVDRRRNRISALVTHFSMFSVTSSFCSHKSSNDQVLSSGAVFKERCRSCTAATTKEGSSLYFTGTGVQYYSYPALGTPNGPCILQDWDGDDPDGDGQVEHTEKMEELDCVIGHEGDYNYPARECTWEEDATPETYGYTDAQHVGGRGTYSFYVQEKGNACRTSEVPVDIVISSLSAGDIATGSLRGGEIHAGTNYIDVQVDNTNGDACASAEVTVTVRGAGFVPSCARGAKGGPGARITQNCQCGTANVDIRGGKELYCCNSGIVVDNALKCVQSASSSCRLGYLSTSDNGCWCGSNQFSFNAAGNAFFCCPGKGLVASGEQCNVSGPSCGMPAGAAVTGASISPDEVLRPLCSPAAQECSCSYCDNIQEQLQKELCSYNCLSDCMGVGAMVNEVRAAESYCFPKFGISVGSTEDLVQQLQDYDPDAAISVGDYIPLADSLSCVAEQLSGVNPQLGPLAQAASGVSSFVLDVIQGNEVDLLCSCGQLESGAACSARIWNDPLCNPECCECPGGLDILDSIGCAIQQALESRCVDERPPTGDGFRRRIGHCQKDSDGTLYDCAPGALGIMSCKPAPDAQPSENVEPAVLLPPEWTPTPDVNP